MYFDNDKNKHTIHRQRIYIFVLYDVIQEGVKSNSLYPPQYSTPSPHGAIFFKPILVRDEKGATLAHSHSRFLFKL